MLKLIINWSASIIEISDENVMTEVNGKVNVMMEVH